MELLDEGREFTAIAGQNDMMAIGALDALHEARIHVPKDVSVIGCDNIFYSGIRKISLTTIDHFVALKGRDAAVTLHCAKSMSRTVFSQILLLSVL